MTDPFTLPVLYRNEELEFDAELRRTGYTHKIAVNVKGTEIIFEPDEERNYRAVLPDALTTKSIPDIELIGAIVAALEAAFKN